MEGMVRIRLYTLITIIITNQDSLREKATVENRLFYKFYKMFYSGVGVGLRDTDGEHVFSLNHIVLYVLSFTHGELK